MEAQVIDQGCRDILGVDITYKKKRVSLIGTYWDVKDVKRNEGIREELTGLVRKRANVLIVGDMNAHIEDLDGRKNKNGEELKEWMLANQLWMVNGSEKWEGKFTWSRNGSETMIDYVLVDTVLFSRIERVRVDCDRNRECKSGHCWIEIVLNTGRWERKERRKGEEVKEFYSNRDEDLEKFAVECEKRFDNKKLDIDKVEEIMKEVANKLLKRKVKWTGGEVIRRYDKCLGDWIKIRRELNRRIRSVREEEQRSKLEESREEIRKKIKDRVCLLVREQEAKEVEMIKENRKGVWNLIKKISGTKRKEREISIVKEGRKLSRGEGDEELCNFWQELYWEEGREWRCRVGIEFKEEGGQSVNKEDGEEAKEIWREHSYCKRSEWGTSTEIKGIELNEAFKDLKDEKAAGLSGLNSRMWRAIYKRMGGKVMAEWMMEVVRGNIPSSWRRNKVCMVQKVEGVEVDRRDFRPITITEVSYKIFGGIMKKRLWEFLEMNGLLRTEQSGFSKGRQIEENILALSLEIDRVKKRKGELFIAGLDINKAFDSVDREALVSELRRIKWDEKWVKCVEEIYGIEFLEIFVGERKVGEIRRNKGIKQGCKVSPVMFLICMNRMIDSLNNVWREERYNVLLFADDVLIMARSGIELREKMNVYKSECRRLGLTVNEGKSEILRIGWGGR